MNDIKITFNKSEYTFKKGMTMLDISKEFQKFFKYDILSCRVNSDIVSLNHILNEDADVDFFDISTFVGNKTYERSAILILVKATKDILGKDVRVELSIDKGVYCVIDGIDKDKLDLINKRMHEIVNNNYQIEKFLVNRIKAIKYYQDIKEYDKVELLKYISNTYITIYKLDNVFDYMYGEMVINTSYIKEFNLEYMDNNKFVLMLPFRFNDNKIEEYVHHEKMFNEIIEYLDWSNRINITTFSDINKLLSKGKWYDLIFMSESKQNKRLQEISHNIKENSNIKMVLISGPSCSGKTTTSKKLKLFLESEGLKPHAISIDDYFKERDDTPLDEFGNKDYESINAIDIELFNKQLEELLEGNEITLPTFNFITGKKEFKNKLKIEKNGILIIEGLHSLNEELTKSIHKDNKFKIYISPLTCLNLDNHNRLNTSDNRLLRRIVRDNLRRGYSASQTLNSWKQVRMGETKYVFPYQDSADVVINTSLMYEINVLKVYAEPLLFSINEDDPNYREAIRLINILRMVLPMPAANIPYDSILREFIGNSCFDE